MPLKKIILVSGPGNIGKTLSIKQFLINCGFSYNKNEPLDFRVVIKIGRKIIGIASGGDDVRTIETNFRFFNATCVDIIVCASKDEGKTIEFVRQEAKIRGVTLLEICLTPQTGAAKQRKEHIKVAAEISAKISKNIP